MRTSARARYGHGNAPISFVNLASEAVLLGADENFRARLAVRFAETGHVHAFRGYLDDVIGSDAPLGPERSMMSRCRICSRRIRVVKLLVVDLEP